jgi:hypothetical protein
MTEIRSLSPRALLALLTVAKFETGRHDRRYVLNVSPAMWGSLRRAGVVDKAHKLTELGWAVEGMHPIPTGPEFHANAPDQQSDSPQTETFEERSRAAMWTSIRNRVSPSPGVDTSQSRL